MSPFYTRKGDDGFTRLLGEGRFPKNDDRLEALGTIDEVSAVFGLARSLCTAPEIPSIILHVQGDLYKLMGELAATPENSARFQSINNEYVLWLEEQIEELNHEITIPKEFIVPGDSTAGAALDMARTVVRRAERRLAVLLHGGELHNPELIRYINRLSSLCFVMEIREVYFSKKDQPTLVKSD